MAANPQAGTPAPTPPPHLVGAAWRLARQHPWAFFAGICLVALLLGFGERLLAQRRSAALPPLLQGQWIWAPGSLARAQPMAFYVARDFDLPRRPRPAEGGAPFAILADESYVLWVNGQRVGSGSYDGETDLYELADWLQAGANRLVVELRSESGAGGLLAGLDVEKRPLLRTDGSWRVVQQAEPGLLRGLQALEAIPTQKPAIWSTSPTGHWWPRDAAHAAHLEAPTSTVWPTRGLRPAPLCPNRLRHTSIVAPWVEIAPSLDCRIGEVGAQSIWDFGREVEGFLEVGTDPREPAQPALLYTASTEPGSDLLALSPGQVVLRAPGSWAWVDHHARRFRYAVVIAMTPRHFVRVWPVDAERAQRFAAPPPPAGVFGVEKPIATGHLEQAIWSRLGESRSAPSREHGP